MNTDPGIDTQHPIAGKLSERLSHLIQYAIRAPSPQNTQPWAFRIRGNGIDVLADREHWLPVADPSGRELAISTGAVVDHLEVAMRAHWMVPNVCYRPDPRDGDLLARIECADEQRPTEEDLERLALISQRHTAARFRPDAGVPPGILADLTQLAVHARCGIRWVDRGPFRSAVGSLIQEADEVLFSGKKFREEFAGWLRTRHELNDDGVPVEAYNLRPLLRPLLPWLVQHVDIGSRVGKEDFERIVSAPALGVLFTYGDEVEDWLDAGRAMSQVLLRATAMGYQCALFDQPMDSQRLRARLAALLNTGSAPQAMMRIGVGIEGAGVSTARRPIESFLSTIDLR